MSGGTSNTFHIEINNPIMTSESDIDYLVNEISRRIAGSANSRGA